MDHQQQQQQQQQQPSEPFSAAKPESFPDISHTNRRSPFVQSGNQEISVKSDARVFAVCGRYACTSGHFTRVWDLLDGELVLSFSHGDTVKGTAAAFRPAADAKDEGARLWIGNNHGELLEADIATSSVVATRTTAHHGHEIVRIHRHYVDVWSLDEGGTLHVWAAEGRPGGVASLEGEPSRTYRLPRGHTFSMVVGDELWYAAGKEVRVLYSTQAFSGASARSMVQDGAGEVTAGTLLKSRPDQVLLSHVDGKISVYSRTDLSCVALVSVGQHKIMSLEGVGGHLWTAFNSGRIAVLEVADTGPWTVRKEWQAHDGAVVRMLADPASFFQLDRSQVVSLGADGRIRVWDGMPRDDWLEDEMRRREAQYCSFQDVRIMVVTWNAGASTPHSLRYSQSDDMFLRDLLQSSEGPDVIVFGFQELVDLEDKTATASKYACVCVCIVFVSC